jgi:hypothetical protein
LAWLSREEEGGQASLPGHKDKSLDLSASDTKPNVTITTLANIGKDVNKQVGDAQGAKSEPMELEVSKVERKLTMPKLEAQPSHPLGLPNWQMRKLQKLNAEELKARNLAWVPKRSIQVHDREDSLMKGAKETKRRGATKGYLSNQRFARDHQHNWSPYDPYPASTTFMLILWNPPSGMFGYPSWPYFDPWMSYGSLYHGGLFPNHYAFE